MDRRASQDEGYSNREINEMLVGHEKLDVLRFAEGLNATKELEEKLLDPQNGILVRIEKQTTTTNGRVTKLERWQSYVLGFCAAITLLLIPLILKFLK